MTTVRLGLDTWPPGITQADQVHNDSMDQLDVFVAAGAKSRTTDAQPGSPTEGDVYIMTASPSGADWGGYDEHDLAIFRSAAWTAIPPAGRIGVFIDDTGEYVVWNGTSYDIKLYDNTKYIGQNLQTGTAYELVLADAGKIIDCSNASPVTVTIPANASVAFPVDTRIDINQAGAGLVSVAITTDTLRGAVNSIGQWNGLSLWKRAATEWVVFGGTT